MIAPRVAILSVVALASPPPIADSGSKGKTITFG